MALLANTLATVFALYVLIHTLLAWVRKGAGDAPMDDSPTHTAKAVII